jgi:hypothetical protein
MRSTPKNCLGVLSGLSPLAERSAYLNFRYFVSAFYWLGHPLRESSGGAEHRSLHQRIFWCFIIGYSSIRVFQVAWATSTPWNPFGRWAYGEETCQCSGGDVIIDGAPRAIDCDVRVWCVGHFLNGLRYTERYLILTDSLRSIKAMLSRKIAHQTHPLVYECKQLCWSLCQNGIEVKLMWIPSHVGLMGNEQVPDIFDGPLSSSDF